MNFQFYLEKLFDSAEFQKFIKDNRDAFPCGGFFTLDFEGKDEQQHLDYYIPLAKKMFSFKINDNCEMVSTEILDKTWIPEKLAINYNFDFKDVAKLIEERMKQENIKSKIQKILLSLQKKEGEDHLIGTVFISALGMLKINISIAEMKISEFEKKSLFDMVNIFKKK